MEKVTVFQRLENIILSALKQFQSLTLKQR